MTRQHFDVIVLGLGGVGSVAAYEAAQRGLRVLGVEQHTPAHNLGSSHGHTRAIRKAYFEHSDYVPLLLDAYEGWARLEQTTGQLLFERVGILQVGPPQGEVCGGILLSARQHNLPIDTLDPPEFRRRFPNLHIDDQDIAVFEKDAGFLYVERAVQTYLDEATRLGAELHFEEPIRDWSIDSGESGRVTLTTDAGTYHGQRMIVAAGCWTARLLPHLRKHLSIVRKHLHWFRYSTETPFGDPYGRERLPVFFFETLGGFFYGFPSLDEFGFKVAEHSGGKPILRPEDDDRQRDADDDDRVADFLDERFVCGPFQRSRHAVCFYTVTPDHHFVLEQHPTHPQIAYVAGLSGHGYKFAPALGRALVDLTVDGSSKLPIEFLSSRRFR